MSDRALIVAALIVGGAIVAASFQTRSRFALSAADGTIAWRMDTWSGQIDICAAGYTPKGPVVRCGAYVIPPLTGPQTNPSGSPQSPSPIQPVTPTATPEGNALGGKEL